MKVIDSSDDTVCTGVTNPDPNLRLAVGNVAFTCTSCGDNSFVDFKNMIFRSIEFYCLGCGSPFKIVNPAFGNSILKTKR